MTTPEESAWTQILEAQIETLMNTRINLVTAQMMITLAKKKIAEEQAKSKDFSRTPFKDKVKSSSTSVSGGKE